jgi:hypothetical protein
MNSFIGIVLALFINIPLRLLGGAFISYKYYQWFIQSSFEADPLNYYQIMAIGLFIGTLFIKIPEYKPEDEVDLLSKSLHSFFIMGIGFPFILLISYIVKLILF